MQTRQLGNSDMQLTPIGFGAWALGGGGWAYAWGPQDDDDSIAAIHAALFEDAEKRSAQLVWSRRRSDG